MGVIVRRYIGFLIILLIPTPLVLALFYSCIPTLFILKMFFYFVYVTFVQYSKRCSKNIGDHSKIEITWTLRYNYIDKNIDYKSQNCHM